MTKAKKTAKTPKTKVRPAFDFTEVKPQEKVSRAFSLKAVPFQDATVVLCSTALAKPEFSELPEILIKPETVKQQACPTGWNGAIARYPALAKRTKPYTLCEAFVSLKDHAVPACLYILQGAIITGGQPAVDTLRTLTARLLLAYRYYFQDALAAASGALMARTTDPDNQLQLSPRVKDGLSYRAAALRELGQWLSLGDESWMLGKARGNVKGLREIVWGYDAQATHAFYVMCDCLRFLEKNNLTLSPYFARPMYTLMAGLRALLQPVGVCEDGTVGVCEDGTLDIYGTGTHLTMEMSTVFTNFLMVRENGRPLTAADTDERATISNVRLLHLCDLADEAFALKQFEAHLHDIKNSEDADEAPMSIIRGKNDGRLRKAK